MSSEDKPTLADIWTERHFDSTDLANLAEVNTVIVHKMITNKPVKRCQAEDVLRALSQIMGVDYSLDTVSVTLFE